MKWKIDYGERDWHPWFAWYPVRLAHEERDYRVWWEWIERSTDNVQGYRIHAYRTVRAGGVSEGQEEK